jgi:hypothetical protein
MFAPHELSSIKVVWELKAASHRIVARKGFLWDERSRLFRVIWDADKSKDPLSKNTDVSLSDAPVCSPRELALLFRACVFQHCLFSDEWIDPTLNKLYQGREDYVSFRSGFQDGKFFCLTPDQNSVVCVDFAASDEEILEDLAKQLESEDPYTADNAKERLQRMSEVMLDAIDVIAEEMCNEEAFQEATEDMILVAAIRKYLEGSKSLSQ